MADKQRVHIFRLVILCLAGSALIAAQIACALFFPQAAPATNPKKSIESTPTLENILDLSPQLTNIPLTEEALALDPQPTSLPIRINLDDVKIEYVYTNGIVTALYHLYGSILDDFVDITITNNNPESLTFVIQSEVEGYTTRAADTIEVPAGESVQISQNPRLLAESVDRLNSERPGSFHIRVVSLQNGDEKLLLDESRQIHLYSRRDFVWIDGFDWHEEYELWAAWVTPTDPQVEALIRSAADYTESGQMWSGYGGNLNDESGGVYERLEAIWRAQQEDYRITYISTMITFGPNTVQRMRLPNEVLDQASGNCVELAILFNSAVEALGLESAIVRIPGHAYAAVRIDAENADYYFVETTMIGQHSFAEAVQVGAQEWEEAKPHFDANDEGYAWVTIPDMREKGITPIPWK